jgi:hypothetical protein
VPSHPHPDPDKDRAGRNAQEHWRAGLCIAVEQGAIGAVAFPDAVTCGPGYVLLHEFKRQEVFERPPFDGHGLPAAQADRYRNVHEVAGIDTVLEIRQPDGCVYHALLSDLHAGRSFTTNGAIKTPRRVFPIDAFIPLA